MIAAGLAVYLLVGAWGALLWLPPPAPRPAAAAAIDDELFAVFGSSRTSRAARRVLLVLLAVIAWPVFWRARCARPPAPRLHRTGAGPGSTMPPRVVGGA